MATAYTNPGGDGDRKRWVLATTDVSLGAGEIANILDGNNSSNSSSNSTWFTDGQDSTGKYIQFDFGDSAEGEIIIDEATWYQNNSTAEGTWQWQGSDDAGTWTDIGSPFVLGGTSTQVQTELSGNTTGYRYYRLLGVSGTLSDSPWIREIEFKIDGAQNLTATPEVQQIGTQVLFDSPSINTRVQEMGLQVLAQISSPIQVQQMGALVLGRTKPKRTFTIIDTFYN